MKPDQFVSSKEKGRGEGETYNSFKMDAGRTSNSNMSVTPLVA